MESHSITAALQPLASTHLLSTDRLALGVSYPWNLLDCLLSLPVTFSESIQRRDLYSHIY